MSLNEAVLSSESGSESIPARTDAAEEAWELLRDIIWPPPKSLVPVKTGN